MSHGSPIPDAWVELPTGGSRTGTALPREQ